MSVFQEFKFSSSLTGMTSKFIYVSFFASHFEIHFINHIKQQAVFRYGALLYKVWLQVNSDSQDVNDMLVNWICISLFAHFLETVLGLKVIKCLRQLKVYLKTIVLKGCVYERSHS